MPPKRQKILKTILCHHWGKFNVKNTTFTLESAHHLLQALQSKKSDHSVKAKLNIYDSGMKIIKKGPFGKSHKVPFLSVLRFFVFKTEPHLVFFGVEKRKKLFYLVVLFRELDQVNEICDLIERKRGGVVKFNTDPEPQILVCQQVKEEVIPICVEPIVELVNNGTQSEPVEEKVVYIQTTEKKEIHTPIIRRNLEYHYDERHTDDMGATRVDALLLRTNKEKGVDSKQWKEDMQYFDYNPDIGTATVSEVGPIFMYTAHFTPAEYNNFGTCESDDSESWGGDSLSSSETQGIVTKKDNGKTVIMAHRGSDAGILL